MKKLFVLTLCVAALAACKNNGQSGEDSLLMQQRDSLNSIIAQKDNEINDIMATLNEIQEGFREISEAEGRVSVAKAGERADKAQQIRENIQFISQRMAQNRELIKKLKSQMEGSSLKADQLSKKALWSKFIVYYYQAYDIALRKAEARKTTTNNNHIQ